MPDFLLQQHGFASASPAIEAAAPLPGKQTLVPAVGVAAPSPSAVARVRAYRGETIDLDGVTYRVRRDGAFTSASEVIAPGGATGPRWTQIAARLIQKPPPPRTAQLVGPKLAGPKLTADTGRKQFWRAVKYYAELDSDPKARAGWDRIKRQYPPAVHAELEARMVEVVRGLTREQRAQLRQNKPGIAIKRRDAQHIAGEHVVETGVVARPKLGPNSLLNFVIGDGATNRNVQRRLEVAAGAAARRARAAGGDPKRAGIDAAKAASRTRRPLPGMDRLADAERRVATTPAVQPPPPKQPLAARPPPLPTVKALRIQPRAPQSAGRAGRAAAGAAAAMLVQVALQWLLAEWMAKLKQGMIDRELDALTPAIEAAIAARAAELAALRDEDPGADVYVNIRLGFTTLSTYEMGEGWMDFPGGVSLVEVGFSRTPWDPTPREQTQRFLGGQVSTIEVVTSRQLATGLDVAPPR